MTKARRTRINHVVIAVACTLVMAAFGAWQTESASAATPKVYTSCWNGDGGKWSMKWKVKPRTCSFNGDEMHAAQVPLTNMRWSTWGHKTACGRGVYVYNGGYRAAATFCLYDLSEVDGYLKIRGVIGRHFPTIDGSGDRQYGTQKPIHFRSET